MNACVAGGRDYIPGEGDRDWLVSVFIENNVDAVIHGGCRGVDTWAGNVANQEGIEVIVAPAEWGKYGKAAGPIRNGNMMFFADILIVFPGGKGTEDITNKAKQANKKIIRRIE